MSRLADHPATHWNCLSMATIRRNGQTTLVRIALLGWRGGSNGEGYDSSKRPRAYGAGSRQKGMKKLAIRQTYFARCQMLQARMPIMCRH